MGLIREARCCRDLCQAMITAEHAAQGFLQAKLTDVLADRAGTVTSEGPGEMAWIYLGCCREFTNSWRTPEFAMQTVEDQLQPSWWLPASRALRFPGQTLQ